MGTKERERLLGGWRCLAAGWAGGRRRRQGGRSGALGCTLLSARWARFASAGGRCAGIIQGTRPMQTAPAPIAFPQPPPCPTTRPPAHLPACSPTRPPGRPPPAPPRPLCSPPTALRLLEEFVDLEEGDTIIQNGANSNVGKVCGWVGGGAGQAAGREEKGGEERGQGRGQGRAVSGRLPCQWQTGQGRAGGVSQGQRAPGWMEPVLQGRAGRAQAQAPPHPPGPSCQRSSPSLALLPCPARPPLPR